MTNEIGKLIKDGFKTIESARKAAQENAGNEAILKNEDGTYAIHQVELEENTKDKAINVINASRKGTSTEVVELNLDFTEDHILRMESSNPDNAPIGIGTKIADRYIDNFKENRFSNQNDAEKAAGKHNGIEGIVKNKDGTYSLYSLSQKDVEKILNDREKFPNIIKISFPFSFYGSAVENLNEIMDLNEKDKNGNYKNTFKRFMERINLKEAEEIDLINLTPEQLKTENTDEYRALEEAVYSLNEEISSLKEMEKAQKILEDIESGKYINLDNLKVLETSLNDIISQVESGKLKLDDKNIASLKSMAVTIRNVKESEIKLSEARKEFNSTVDDAAKQVYAMDAKVKELKGKLFLTKEERFTLNTLEAILGKYVKISASGNRENIALYSVFMKGMLDYLATGGTDGDKIKLMMSKYNGIALLLNEFNEKGVLTEDARSNFFYHLNALGASPEEKKIFENYFSKPHTRPPQNPANYEFVDEPVVDVHLAAENPLDLKKIGIVGPGPVAPVKSDENIFAYSAPLKKPEPLDLFTDEQIEEAGKAAITPEIMKPLIPLMEKTVGSLEKVGFSAFEYSEREVKLDNSLEELFKKAGETKDILTGLRKLMKDDIEKRIKGLTAAHKAINKIILIAEKLLAAMKLGVDGSAANIADLLQKFREIISELDIETRELILQKLTAKLIDESFTKYLKENSDNMKNFESVREMFLKVFQESSEVKESDMPFDLKQIKLADNSLKIALIALYHIK